MQNHTGSGPRRRCLQRPHPRRERRVRAGRGRELRARDGFHEIHDLSWVEIEGAEKPDQILDTQIKQSVEKVLAGKGLKKVDGDEATLFIAYQVAIGQERQWNSYNTGGYGSWRYGGGTSTATSTTINIGTIALDMYDPAKKELMWKGQASKTIDEKANPEKRQKNLDKAMTKLLKDFPPKPKSQT